MKVPSPEWTKVVEDSQACKESNKLERLALSTSGYEYDIDDEMVAERDAGEPFPVRSRPFAVMSAPDENGHEAMIERSTMQLDVNDLDRAERFDTLDINNKTDVLRAGAVVKFKVDLRETPR